MVVWETLESSFPVQRAKVPGGWLIYITHADGLGITFYPDPDHAWDGNTLP